MLDVENVNPVKRIHCGGKYGINPPTKTLKNVQPGSKNDEEEDSGQFKRDNSPRFSR